MLTGNKSGLTNFGADPVGIDMDIGLVPVQYHLNKGANFSQNGKCR